MKAIIYKEKGIIPLFENLSINIKYCENESEALALANEVSILFISNETEDLALAKKIQGINSSINIIFISKSKSTKNAYEAFKMHASGFLVQPVKKEAIEDELHHLRYGTYSRVYIQCFGKFEIYGDGYPISFKRKKCLEFIAYLFDHQGAKITSNELCQALFGEVSDKKKTYVYVLRFEIGRVLESYGLKDAVANIGLGFAIDTNAFDSDYKEYINGNVGLFKGEYMSQYKWAENTLNKLNEEIEER